MLDDIGKVGCVDHRQRGLMYSCGGRCVEQERVAAGGSWDLNFWVMAVVIVRVKIKLNANMAVASRSRRNVTSRVLTSQCGLDSDTVSFDEPDANTFPRVGCVSEAPS